MKKTISLLILISFLIPAYSVIAAVMSSQNYKIQQDSLNIGGGDDQASTNYKIKDTVGELATGESASANYKLKAGYRQMVEEVYLSISDGANVTMSPTINGLLGGTGNGSTFWTVITDNPAGYLLSIRASTSPALKSGSYYFIDYTSSSSGVPDYTWSIASTDSEFGFTAEGSHTSQRFLDNGSDACNIGSSNTTDKCWYNLSASNITISSSASANHPSGTLTTVKFRAESGASHVQEAGTYTATVTVTAATN